MNKNNISILLIVLFCSSLAKTLLANQFQVQHMSWQAYVDTNMVGTGKILKAAIYGHDGSLWATTAGFNVSEK